MKTGVINNLGVMFLQLKAYSFLGWLININSPYDRYNFGSNGIMRLPNQVG